MGNEAVKLELQYETTYVDESGPQSTPHIADSDGTSIEITGENAVRTDSLEDAGLYTVKWDVVFSNG